jgi:hypothetical protein
MRKIWRCSNSQIADILTVRAKSAFGKRPKAQEVPDRSQAKEHARLVVKLRVLATEGNVVAVIFALKVRHTHRDGETPEDGRTNVHVNINLPSAITHYEYQRVSDVTPWDR